VKLVIDESERNQRVHIEQINHGKFAKISSTSLLVNVGASGPALKAGSPVAASVTILTRWRRLFTGVNMIRPDSMLASKGIARTDPEPTARRTRGDNLALGGYFGRMGRETYLTSPLPLKPRSGRLNHFPSFPTKALTASDTVIISVIGSIGEAVNPHSS